MTKSILVLFCFCFFFIILKLISISQTNFNLYGDETLSLFRLLQRQKITLKEADNTITGFNVGFNSGCDAGQTIEHAHVHLIPRRKDDVEDPIGGIRNVFPGKGNYKI